MSTDYIDFNNILLYADLKHHFVEEKYIEKIEVQFQILSIFVTKDERYPNFMFISYFHDCLHYIEIMEERKVYKEEGTRQNLGDFFSFNKKIVFLY